MKILFYILIAMGFAEYSHAQLLLDWVQRYSGSEATSISVNGSICVAGLGSDGLTTIKYNSSGTEEWVQNYTGIEHGFMTPVLKTDSSDNIYVMGNNANGSVIIKYNTSGIQQWIKLLNATELTAITIDKSGNLIVTGAVFDSTTEQNFVTIKFSSTGSKNWETNYSGTGNGSESAIALAVDDLENVYVSGYSYSLGYSDIVTVKYNSSGTQQWVRAYGSGTVQGSLPEMIQIDDSQNVYVAGYNSNSGAIIKYTSAGDELWVINDGGAVSLTLDNFNNIYVTGVNINQTRDSGIALRKYNPDGIKQWTKYFQGYESGIDSRIPMTTDTAGNVYLSFTAYDITGLNSDIFIAKCDSSGIQKWEHRFDGYAQREDFPNAISLDKSGNVYVVGKSTDTIINHHFVTIKYSQIISNISTQAIHTKKFYLEQNYPNPFNPGTVIRYTLVEKGFVNLKVYDMLGKEVITLKNEKQSAGSQQVVFNASGLANGIYFYKIMINSDNGAEVYTATKKMILLK